MANITAAQAQQIASLAFLGSSSNSLGPFASCGVLQRRFTDSDMAVRSVQPRRQYDYPGTAWMLHLPELPCSGGIGYRGDLTLHVMSDAPSDPSQAFVFATVAAVPEPSTWAGGVARLLWHRCYGLLTNNWNG